MPRPAPTREQLIARFWSKVDKRGEDDCWLWKAALFSTGYGAFRWGKNNVGAHKLAYELAVGPIPEGYHVHHECETRGCCNPSHLKVLTPLEHGGLQPSAKATHCKRGHEFTPENTKWQGPEKQWRQCRICFNANVQAHVERKKQRQWFEENMT